MAHSIREDTYNIPPEYGYGKKLILSSNYILLYFKYPFHIKDLGKN